MLRMATQVGARYQRCRDRDCTSRALGDFQWDKSARLSQVERVKKLRHILSGSELVQAPCCHDGLSAKLIEDSGMDVAFMSGFTTAAARLAYPDTGLLSYAEVLDTGRCVFEATRGLCVIGDADTGYGNAMNVRRTVQGFINTGFAGIILEDQVSPKSCGHVKDKAVINALEAQMKIRAAVDTRNELGDLVIVGRTDARQAVSLDEALLRVNTFADEGVDIIFIDALESEQEIKLFAKQAPQTWKMINLLEGGKTPLLEVKKLQDMGYKIASRPFALLSASIAGQQAALQQILRGEDGLAATSIHSKSFSFQELKAVVGFNEYYNFQERYATEDEQGSIHDEIQQQLQEMQSQENQQVQQPFRPSASKDKETQSESATEAKSEQKSSIGDVEKDTSKADDTSKATSGATDQGNGPCKDEDVECLKEILRDLDEDESEDSIENLNLVIKEIKQKYGQKAVLRVQVSDINTETIFFNKDIELDDVSQIDVPVELRLDSILQTLQKGGYDLKKPLIDSRFGTFNFRVWLIPKM